RRKQSPAFIKPHSRCRDTGGRRELSNGLHEMIIWACPSESKSTIVKITTMRVTTIVGAMMLLAMESRADIPATTQPGEEYQLVWSDEFNHDGPLDSKDWQYESGFARNRELQWYQPENAFCKDGNLIIEAR